MVESSIDDNVGLIADKGRFYDGNGGGHVAPIRWSFPNENYTFEQVLKFAGTLDNRYRAIMEDTCPDH